MEEPADSAILETKDVPGNSSLVRTTSRRSIPGRFTSGRSAASGRSTPGGSTSGKSPSGRSTSGISTSGRSTSVRSTPDRSITPEPPPVPPATYHWEEVRRKRSVGGYPWTHLNKAPFDEKTFVKYERDHVYEPVASATSTDQISSSTKQVGPSKDNSRHFLRIPLTEELVMADDTDSEPEDEQQKSKEDNCDENGNKNYNFQKKQQSDESIYEGENENSSVGDVDTSTTRMKMFQQKVKVKTDILRTKLQGVTKRKPKQKIVVDEPNGEKSRRKFGQFATLPKKFTFNASKVNFSTAFSNFTRNSVSTDINESNTDESKSGRFSLHRFAFSKTSSESPKPSKSTKIGASRLSIPSLRSRTWSDASKVSKPDNPKPKLMDFGTYPRIFSKRKKTNAANRAKTPPPSSSNVSDGKSSERKDSFRRRFFRTYKESTPAPTEEQTATLAVEEELDESHVSKESLAEFGDSDLQEVISLSDDGRSKDTKSLSDHRPGVIEEIDSDEFFLREKGLSRGNVHISNYLSSEIRDVFRSNRTRSVEGVDNSKNNNHVENNNENGTTTPVRPSRTNSLRRPIRSQNIIDTNVKAIDRFSTMPKSFGGTKTLSKPEDDMPENIITSQIFEPSQNSGIPSTFKVPWRTVQKETPVTHIPPKPPTRQRMSKFSTFDTRSMIDLSRKRSQSQIGFLPSMNFSDTVPKAPLRKSRTSLAGSDRDISVHSTFESRQSWAVGGGVPTPPMRRSRMSLTADVGDEERSPAQPVINGNGAVTIQSRGATPPSRPPPPTRVTVGYATVDKQSLLVPPQSPVRHRRKKSYDVIKSQEFGAFFTIPRSYNFNNKKTSVDGKSTLITTTHLLPPQIPPQPSRPTRAYNTLGPSRPLRRRLPVREHEYGDVADGSNVAAGGLASDTDSGNRQTVTMAARSSSLDDAGTEGSVKVLYSGDVIEKMKLRPLPSPPAPPRKTKAPGCSDDTPETHRRRNTDSALVPFLDRRETSATSSDDFFADVSRALLASAAKNAVVADDVSIGVQTDPLPDGYEPDDLSSCCSAELDRPTSRASSNAAERPVSRTSISAADRPTSRISTNTEYVDRPTSRISTTAVENGYVMMPDVSTVGLICAQRLNVSELQVGKMIVADVRSQRMGVDHMSGSSLEIGHLAASSMTMMPEMNATAARAMLQTCADDPHHDHQQLQDDTMSVPSSRVSSSMYPEVDSDEDRGSVLAAPTPPRRRSKPTSRVPSSAAKNRCDNDRMPQSAVDLTAANVTISELSCQLFRLCHSNVCSLFNKVVQQVVPEDTEKRRDLQAALCFLSIILAGMLILGFGNEKTIHHHHWDFQFPPPHQ